MGCDIHLVVEVKRGKAWEPVAAPKLAWHDEWQRGWFSDRNYNAFAILAGVRNGAHGEEMTPIAEPRGRPKGMADHAKAYEPEDEDDTFWLGDHSFSWVTLAELIAYPFWEKTRICHGVIKSSEYAGWAAKQKVKRAVNEGPDSYSQGVFGDRVRTLTETAYLAAGKPVDDRTYVSVQWGETCAYAAGRLYSHFIPALTAWAKENGARHEDVRIVFGFDS